MLGDFLPTLGSRYLVLQANSLTGPAGDNAADVGMTIPSSDQVIELVVANELNTEPIADAGGTLMLPTKAPQSPSTLRDPPTPNSLQTRSSTSGILTTTVWCSIPKRPAER